MSSIQNIAATKATEGFGKLVKRTFGGVTEESARQAISHVANAVGEEADVVILNLNKSHDAIVGSYAKQLAEKETKITKMTEKVRSQETQIAEQSRALNETETQNKGLIGRLNALTAKIQEMLTFKPIAVNPDGSTVLVKSNLNGAKATRIVSSEGSVLENNVVLADKTFRRTIYDPVTKKPIKTQTNANKERKVIEITYNSEGQAVSTKPINVSRDAAKAANPTVVHRDVIPCSSVTKYITKMSDDTTIVTVVNKINGRTEYQIKYPKEVEIPITKDGSESHKFIEMHQWELSGDVKEIIRKRENGVEKATFIYRNGVVLKNNYSRTVDELTGIVTSKHRFVMPKSSPVKYVQSSIVEGATLPSNHVIQMRNGESYIFTDFRKFNNGTHPNKATKILEDGTKVELSMDEMKDILSQYHPSYNSSLLK